ncbi:hypothetical protein SDJN03_23217, partial [Cucurbita argyrosperma subsp. sororia]
MAALTDFCRDSGDISTRNDLNTSPEMLKPSSASSDDVSPNSRGKSSDSGINMEGTAGDRAFAFEEVVRTQASGGCVDHPDTEKAGFGFTCFNFHHKSTMNQAEEATLLSCLLLEENGRGD